MGALHHLSEEALRDELAALIASFDRPVIVAGIAGVGVKLFVLYLDEIGTPCLSVRFVLRWSGLANSPETVFEATDRALDGLSADGDAESILVIKAADGVEQEEALRAVYAHSPTARVLEAPRIAIEGLLRRLLAETPLRQAYELILVRQCRDDTLELVGRRLFAPGARPGEHAHETVRCVDHGGILLAVSAWADPVRPTDLVSLDHAPLSPGRHLIKAVLERPGVVSFPGIPGLRHDDRPWSDVVAALPRRLPPPPPPVHLICAVEVTGSPDEVKARRHQVVGLVEELARRHPKDKRLEVSVIAYGTHVFGTRRADTSAPDVPVWSASAEEAVKAIESLPAVSPTYPEAAQVEDMLHEVSTRLVAGDATGRTALVTAGVRGPHPARVDLSHVIPCPGRYDWDRLVEELRVHHDLRFGAICDVRPGAESPWRRLGAAALSEVSAVDKEEFLVRLGALPGGSHRLPLPMID